MTSEAELHDIERHICRKAFGDPGFATAYAFLQIAAALNRCADQFSDIGDQLARCADEFETRNQPDS